MKFLSFVTAANLEAILLVTSRVWRRSLGGAGAESPSRDFKMPRPRRRRERQNSNRLTSKNNNSASASRFLYISLQSLHNHDGKCPISLFMEEVNKRRLNFSLFLNLNMVCRSSAQKELACI